MVEYIHKEGDFKFGILKNIITEEENNHLVDIIQKTIEPDISSIKGGGYFIDNTGFKHHNKWVFPTGELELQWERYKSILTDRFNSKIITNYYPHIENTSSTWKFGLTISSDAFLGPHNDDPVAAKKYALANNLKATAGIYKGVIYLGHINTNYSNYGTKFYKVKDQSGDLSNISNFDLLLEVPFVPGDGCIFEANENSYHGTHYTDGFNFLRYTITFQYY